MAVMTVSAGKRPSVTQATFATTNVTPETYTREKAAALEIVKRGREQRRRYLRRK